MSKFIGLIALILSVQAFSGELIKDPASLGLTMSDDKIALSARVKREILKIRKESPYGVQHSKRTKKSYEHVDQVYQILNSKINEK